MAGAGAKTVREIMTSVTTTAALEVIEAAGAGDAARASLAAAIEDRLRRRAAGACDIAAVVFDAERRELFRTSAPMQLSGNWGRRMSKGVLYGVGRAIGWPGTKVVMKARRSLADAKRILREEGAFDGAELVEDCGLPASACTARSTMCRSGQLLLDDGGALDEGFLHSVH